MKYYLSIILIFLSCCNLYGNDELGIDPDYLLGGCIIFENMTSESEIIETIDVLTDTDYILKNSFSQAIEKYQYLIDGLELFYNKDTNVLNKIGYKKINYETETVKFKDIFIVKTKDKIFFYPIVFENKLITFLRGKPTIINFIDNKIPKDVISTAIIGLDEKSVIGIEFYRKR